MEILNRIKDGEVIEFTAESSTSQHIKNSIISNIMYIVLWLAFDVFFIYIISKENISQQFWFITIPICGLNLLRVWVYVFDILKKKTEIAKTGYCLTNKALYYFSDGKYKELKRIGFEEIVAVEKSEYLCDGFFVASLDKTIQVINIKEEKELFEIMIKKINQEPQE